MKSALARVSITNIFICMLFIVTTKQIKRKQNMQNKIHKTLQTRNYIKDDEGASDRSLEQLVLAVLH